MLAGQIVVIVSVALLIAMGIRARLTVCAPNSYTRKQFLIWAPLAALVLMYVLADAMAAHHNWFGNAAMLFMLGVSTYNLMTNLKAARRRNP